MVPFDPIPDAEIEHDKAPPEQHLGRFTVSCQMLCELLKLPFGTVIRNVRMDPITPGIMELVVENHDLPAVQDGHLITFMRPSWKSVTHRTEEVLFDTWGL